MRKEFERTTPEAVGIACIEGILRLDERLIDIFPVEFLPIPAKISSS